MVAKRFLKEQLQDEGLWKPFVKERERIRKQLHADGWAPKDAAKECQARAEAAYENGLLSSAAGSGPREGGTPASEGGVVETGDEADDSWARPIRPRSTESPPAADAGTSHRSSVMPSAPAGGETDPGLSLAFWHGKPPASAFEEVNWVAQNWMIEDVTAADAPSPGAWGLRSLVRENHTFRGEFYKSIWSKTLPTKQQLELAERYRDDGRAGFELFDRLEQAIQDDVERLEQDETATPSLSIWGNAS